MDYKEQLKELVTKLYNECGVDVEPMFPKVLLRVLPREHKAGDIWLPENKQNKPTLEGVVLKTYKPFMQKVWVKDITWRKADWKTDEEASYWQKVESAVQAGDHVLFPHIEYGIVPVWPLDGGLGEYRMVPEDVLTAKLTYPLEHKEDWLAQILWEANDESHENIDVAKFILNKADVVRKDLGSLTTSGA